VTKKLRFERKVAGRERERERRRTSYTLLVAA